MSSNRKSIKFLKKFGNSVSILQCTTKYPTSAIDIGLNIILTPLYAHKGIALASSLTAFLQTALLIWKLSEGGHFRLEFQLVWDGLRFSFAAILAILAGVYFPTEISPLPEFFLGICVYFFLLFAVKYLRPGKSLI